MLITNIASLAGIVGLILTLLLMSHQTRKLTEQTITGNAIAQLDAHYNALERLHDLNRVLLDTPNLQPYFLLGKECQADDPDYNSVRLLGEMFADVFDLGLELHRRIKDDIHHDCWDTTVIEALKQPVLRQAITSGAPWWPDLRLFIQQRPELLQRSLSAELQVDKSENPDILTTTGGPALPEKPLTSKKAERETSMQGPQNDAEILQEGAEFDHLQALTAVAPRQEKETEFSLLQALAVVAPCQAIIDSWGLLEYQLRLVADRLSPGNTHGWPQVVDTLEAWDKWRRLCPVVLELRHLRDYTIQAAKRPSSLDASRYVSVVEDLVTSVRTALVSHTEGSGAGGSDVSEA